MSGDEEDFSVILEVRSDIDRGILVLTISWEETRHDVHFFKHQHQPINQHPEQIQRIVRQARPTTRTKSVKVNIVSFSALYWNATAEKFEFKGVKLNSTEQQVLKVHETRINKEVAVIKRKKTMEATKKNNDQAIRAKLVSDEAKFQVERAKRIKAAKQDMMETDTTETKDTTK